MPGSGEAPSPSAYLRAGDEAARSALAAPRLEAVEPIAEIRLALSRDPRDLEALRALRRAHAEARRHDATWCAAAAIDFVTDARRGARAIIRPASRLDQEAWLRRLRHPDEDLLVAKIFEQVWPAFVSLRGKSDRDAGLQMKHEVDPNVHSGTMIRTFGFVAQVLGIQTPRLFVRADVPGGLTPMLVWPLATLSGSTLLSGFSAAELMFVCARHLADYRGERYVRTILPSPTELRTVLVAALRLAGVVPRDPEIDAVAVALRSKMQPSQVWAIQKLAERFAAGSGRADLEVWLRGAELTACRAGALLSADLGTSARMIGRLGATGPADLPVRRKIDEMITFFVSDEHLALREHLGLAT